MPPSGPPRCSPAEAAARLDPTDTLGIPLGPGHPPALLHALGERTDWTNLTISGALLLDLYSVFSHPGVHYLCGFYGPAERLLVDAGANIDFVPSDFRRFAPILEKLAPRVMAALAAPPDDHGWCSLSLHAGATLDELMRAARDPDRLAIIETSLDAPRTLGLRPEHPHAIHLDEIDVLIEGNRPMFTLPDDVPDDLDQLIASHVRPYIADGSTLQTGIGGIPSTIASMLATDDGGDYGIHSEMFTTGLMQLHRAGKVTNTRKGQFDGLSVTTFALGSAEMNHFLDGNEQVRFLPASVVNSPEIVARNRRMVTINGALTVDLWGQAVADTINGRQFSGIGGHEDFVAASGFDLEDRALLCLRSTAVVGGQVISRIQAQLPAGAVVTTPRHQLDLVVTEYGVASLRGRTVRQRAAALAAIAHPDFRDELSHHAATIA